MPQGLLEHDTRDLIEPDRFRLSFQHRVASRHIRAVQTFARLVGRLPLEAQAPIIDIPHTPKRLCLGKQLLLLCGGIEAEFIGSRCPGYRIAYLV